MKIFGKELSFSHLLYNKKVVMTISIVVAVLFWAFINISESPTITKEIRNIPVTVSTEGTVAGSMGLDIVSGAEGTVATVGVSGPRYIVSGLTADDITVTASLDGVNSAGEKQLRLVATKNGANTDYTITGVYPGEITVLVDEIETRPLPVEAVLDGGSVADGLEFDVNILSLDDNGTIQIRGPKTMLDKISRVVAAADIGGTLSETKTFDAAIRLYDGTGAEMDSSLFTIVNTDIKVTVNVFKTKELPVKATFTNAPAAYSATPIAHTVSVAKITVKGEPKLIDSMESVSLSPIDFSAITENSKTFKCTPVLPAEVTTQESTGEITVEVTADIYSKTFTVTAFKAAGLESGLKMEIASSKKSLTVTVCGSRDSVRALKSDDLYGTVDLSGKTAGESTPQVKISSDKYGDIWVSGTHYIAIKIS